MLRDLRATRRGQHPPQVAATSRSNHELDRHAHLRPVGAGVQRAADLEPFEQVYVLHRFRQDKKPAVCWVLLPNSG